MDLRRNVRMRRVKETASERASADRTVVDPPLTFDARTSTNDSQSQPIARLTVLQNDASTVGEMPTNDTPSMGSAGGGALIDLTNEEDPTEDSPSNFASAGISPSPERKEHGLLQELFAPRSPPVSITQRQVRASNWQLKHSRMIDTSGAHIDLRAIFTGEMWKKDEIKHTPALESVSTAEPTPSFEPPSMFDW